MGRSVFEAAEFASVIDLDYVPVFVLGDELVAGEEVDVCAIGAYSQ